MMSNTKITSEIQQSVAAGAPVLTFIKDRLYFTTSSSVPAQRPDLHFFTIDHVLVYQHFYADFGPLNLAQTLRFCELAQQLLQQPELANKKLVMYSGPAADKKANALFLLCAFLMLVYKQTPEQACAPIASVAETIMPFRDAGYGPDTYHISILDCLQGLDKAMACKLLNLEELDLEEYEYYERIEHGDMNWLMRNKFLAFATPHDDPATRSGDPGAYPKTAPHPANENILPHGVPWRLHDYAQYFKKNKITTVVRLNHKVYDRQRFVEQGVEHIELYFHDGSCPSMEILAAFLEIAESDRRLAIHCKAGLGRTGSLIAAYLMKHYRFTASEIIGYLRIMRPGSVVGPQQNWLYSMQATLWAMGARDATAARAAASSLALATTASSSILKAPAAAAAAGHNQYVAAVAAASAAPLSAMAARAATSPLQAYAIETAVPATKTTMIGQHTVAIPVQPRKGSDVMIPSSSFLHAVEQLLITDGPRAADAPVSPLFHVADAAALKASSRYNLRATTVAARSTPSSRSNSITFDPFTPRSTSNASLKMKQAALKIVGAAGRGAAASNGTCRKDHAIRVGY